MMFHCNAILILGYFRVLPDVTFPDPAAPGPALTAGETLPAGAATVTGPSIRAESPDRHGNPTDSETIRLGARSAGPGTVTASLWQNRQHPGPGGRSVYHTMNLNLKRAPAPDPPTG